MQKQLTTGPVMPTMLQFAVPMILGDLLQQCYNIADTLIVGRFIGTGALAAVGSAFTLMTFLTSILLGLAMGSGTVFSIKYGQKDDAGLKEGILASFVLLAGVTAVLVFAVYAGFDGIIWFLRIPAEIDAMMRTYLRIVFAGLAATFLYNYFASLLRAACRAKLRPARIKEIASFSALTCIQQSVMNLGILAVQGLVNSFGTVVMAAFAAAVKIDAFAYLPVQDFGNAFSIFLAQNYGAQEKGRLKQGMRGAFAAAAGFSVAVSAVVYGFAVPLMRIFIDAGEMDVIAEGVRYLHIEGAFYLGIGWLFLLYGLYRAVGRPGMSVVLTVISLGIRVALAYTLSAIPAVGVVGIWWSVPIGWFLADAMGLGYYWWKRRTLFEMR